MKIGFDDTPAAPVGTYSQHLARLLAEYAPEHEYIIDGKRCKEFDLYHGFRPGLPFPVLLRRIPCVMTVHNLNFLRDRKSTRLNSSHWNKSRMPSSA